MRSVGAVDGIERLRFTSPRPSDFADDVIEARAETPAVMPRLHMPLQSGADAVLRAGVQGCCDLITMPGLINLDFADIRTVMSEMGKAMMGTGEADGERRAVDAAEAAISNPLLDEVSMRGARGVLINITGGPDMTLFEVDEAANRIKEEVDPDANIIFGTVIDDALGDEVKVTVIAAGFAGEHKERSNPLRAVTASRQRQPAHRHRQPRVRDEAAAPAGEALGARDVLGILRMQPLRKRAAEDRQDAGDQDDLAEAEEEAERRAHHRADRRTDVLAGIELAEA